ncbi:Calcineurin-like phosphoesterase [Symmachiella dynata]|uniref:Calcineurin-like phosphoesterase n=1 Tax=Symmachiella dynata TaxID=2527995 RepID=A0A517ZIZ3_9PLAN|nr:metallophosphoesterase family protein [Symmachiella dynata]QDU42448.1 Calcineurin-like phosphoesterase [Symmachiella dynata]
MQARVKFICSLATVLGLALAVYVARPDRSPANDQEKPPEAVAEEILHRPTAMPDRILLTWNDDVATTQAVTWRTDTSVKKGYAQIALAEDGPMFTTKSKDVSSTKQLLDSDLGQAHYHTAHFTDLTPKTLYVYRVGDGVNWSSWTHFRTPSTEAEPFTFIYFGDAQNNLKAHWWRVFREAYADAPRAQFMLHAGDLINRGSRDAEWGDWVRAGGWVNAMIPSVAIPGNHEYSKYDPNGNEYPDGQRQLSTHWPVLFEFPTNGPDSLSESAYWFDFQGTRFICLNSNEQIDVQTPWLEGVLKDNPNKWTVVTHHHPIYPSSRAQNPEIRDGWQPLYDKYGVDIVLQGHDHSYGRTGLMGYEQNLPTGVTVQSEKAGTLYVVSVSGPKQYGRNDFPFVRRAEDTQLYQIITVDGDELRYDARTATGALYDAFTLRKRDGEVNELIERVPDTPEYRRPEIKKKP